MDDDDGTAAVTGQLTATLEVTIATLGAIKGMIEPLVLKARKANSFGDKQATTTSQVSFERPSAVQKSPLLSLPPEIRNMIWKLCLSHPEGLGDKMKLQKIYGCFTMVIHHPYDDARPKIREAYESSTSKRTKQSIREHSLRNLALMETCQTAYNDAAPVLWAQRFTFHSILQLQAFLFSDARLDLVRDIYVDRLDPQVGVNYMPSICTILADKVKGLERFDVNMGRMHHKRGGPSQRSGAFEDDDEIREAGVKLGFDVYSCMHPWVTKVVQNQGIERLMKILHITRETEGQDDISRGRIHSAFEGGGQLTADQRDIADAATAGEILRLVNLYKKRA